MALGFLCLVDNLSQYLLKPHSAGVCHRTRPLTLSAVALLRIISWTLLQYLGEHSLLGATLTATERARLRPCLTIQSMPETSAASDRKDQQHGSCYPVSSSKKASVSLLTCFHQMNNKQHLKAMLCLLHSSHKAIQAVLKQHLYQTGTQSQTRTALCCSAQLLLLVLVTQHQPHNPECMEELSMGITQALTRKTVQVICTLKPANRFPLQCQREK